MSGSQRPDDEAAGGTARVRLFLCGDVMTGRGIDQVLPSSVSPVLYEPWVTDARRYVQLAEMENGPIPAPVEPSYVWGDALAELERAEPDARIVNLETAVTTSEAAWPGKGVHYRMHPANVPLLTAARIDCCVLANNHVLDWGHPGLDETLEALRGAQIGTCGAGRDLAAAQAPAVIEVGAARRVLVLGLGSTTSGVPESWAAGEDRAGVFLLPDRETDAVPLVRDILARERRPGDLVVASIHMGSNWGHAIPRALRRLAHRLIDEAGVAVIHGHSSHHVKAIEVYHGHLILHGCGDLLNDYEGIGGFEAFRGGLALLYFPTLDPGSGELESLEMVPVITRRFRLERGSAEDAAWLAGLLNAEGAALGTGAEVSDRAGRLRLTFARS